MSVNRSLRLLKDHRVGIWCRRAAWIILIIGLIRTALAIYSNLLSYSSFPGASPVPQQLITMAADLTILIDVLFYFFILYAAAVVIEHLTGSVGSTREEDLEVEDLDEEDLDQGDLEVVDLDKDVPERLQK